MCSNFSFHWSVTYLSQGWVFLHTFQRSTNPWIELSGPLPFRHLHSTDMGKNPFHARQKLHRVVCKVGSRHYKRQDERYMSGTAVILNKVEPQLVGTLKARTSTTAQVTSIGGFKGTTTHSVWGFFHCSHIFITLATRTQSQGYKMNLVGVRWNLRRNMDHHPLVLACQNMGGGDLKPTEKSYWWSWFCLKKPTPIRNSESSVGYK